MRAVTFADEKVVSYLNKNFVAVWNNHSPDRGIQPAAQYTPAQMKAYPEGGGAGNVRMFFASPDGAMLGEIQGYWKTPTVLRELTFAVSLTAKNAVKKHQDRFDALNAEREKLVAEHPDEMKRPFHLSEVRRRAGRISQLSLWHSQSQKHVVAKARIVAHLRQVQLQQVERGIIK